MTKESNIELKVSDNELVPSSGVSYSSHYRHCFLSLDVLALCFEFLFFILQSLSIGAVIPKNPLVPGGDGYSAVVTILASLPIYFRIFTTITRFFESWQIRNGSISEDLARLSRARVLEDRKVMRIVKGSTK